MWDEDEFIDRLWEISGSPYTSHRKKAKANPTTKFKVGDAVRLIAGQALQHIIKVDGDRVIAEYPSRSSYASSGYRSSGRWRPARDYVYHSTHEHNAITTQTESKGTNNMTTQGKLYQTNEDTPRFGTLLAVNSQGKLVLEMKGTGIPELFDAKSVNVVMPYTFSVVFGNNSTEYSYKGKEGEVELGDLLLLDSSPRGELTVARVVGVNTKSDAATKHFVGVKLQTTPVGK